MYQFGRMLSQIHNLNNLYLKFPIYLLDEVIIQFSKHISKCRQLKYLVINFKYGSVEMISPSPNQTIFDNQKVEIHSFELYYNSTLTEIHTSLMIIILFNTFTNIKQLFIENITLSSISILEKEFKKQFENLMIKCSKLSSFYLFNDNKYYFEIN